MAVQYSFGKIVTDGLVLALDAADRNSYVSGSLTWRDVAGSNNGTLTNGPTFNSANNGSIVFDGIDDNATFNNIPGTSFSLISSSFTTEFWIYTTTGSSQGFISSNQTAANGGQYAFLIRSNGIFVSFYGTPTYTDVYGGDVITGSWSHYVNTFNYDNQSSSIYVNGILRGTSANLTGTVTQNLIGAAYIGTWGSFGGYYFNGNIAQTHIYNRALTLLEIQQNFTQVKNNSPRDS